MEKGEFREGKSLEETPTWAVATVVTFMVSFGFLVHHSLKKFGEVKTMSPVFYSLISHESETLQPPSLIVFNVFASPSFFNLQWLDKTKRKSLLAALEKIKDGKIGLRLILLNVFVVSSDKQNRFGIIITNLICEQN